MNENGLNGAKAATEQILQELKRQLADLERLDVALRTNVARVWKWKQMLELGQETVAFIAEMKIERELTEMRAELDKQLVARSATWRRLGEIEREQVLRLMSLPPRAEK